jgi:hypothetical protein
MAYLATLLAMLLSAATAATATSAPAPAACHVHLVPTNAGRAWVLAASALEQALRATPPGDNDCSEIVIRATSEHASVEVTTLDGRHGVRSLADALEVEPTVAALIVTVRPESVVDRSPAPAPAPAPAAAPPLPAPAGSRRAGWRPLVAAGAGARLTLPRTPVPVVELMLGAASGSAEVALFAAWAPTVLGTTASAQATFSSSAEVGVDVARRQPIGRGDLLLGVRAGAIRFAPSTRPPDAAQTGQNDDPTAAIYAPTAAAFVAAALPALGIVRIRPQLSVQWIPPLRAGAATDTTPPSLWSVGLSVGAESRIP